MTARFPTTFIVGAGPVATALAGDTLTTIVSKVEAVGPKSFHMDLPLLENRFQFKRALEALRRQD